MLDPIGVFDSGIGGLSILRQIRTHLPHEPLLYIADSAHAPYGEKSVEFIIERCVVLTEFLLSQHVKAIVVACNTATAAAITHLRAQFFVPIIGVEPAVKPAALMTQSGVVGVLATNGTLSSPRFENLVERFSVQVKVIVQPCPGLVECIEQGELDTPKIQSLLARYLAPLLKQGADTIVLGCTHYPLIISLIRKIAGEGITIIDTGEAVSRQLKLCLYQSGLLADTPEPGKEVFWTTGDDAVFGGLVRRLWK